MKKLALLMLALAACDGGGDASEPRQVKKIEVGNSAYLEQLRGLNERDRTLTLRRAVLDSGQSCRRAEGSEESGRYENMVTFTLRCEGGRNWAVFVAPNGDTQVRSCEHVQQLGLPACRTGDQPAGSNSSKE